MSPHGGASNSNTSTTSRIFGATLMDLMGENCEKGLPKIVTQCMEYVLEHGNLLNSTRVLF